MPVVCSRRRLIPRFAVAIVCGGLALVTTASGSVADAAPPQGPTVVAVLVPPDQQPLAGAAELVQAKCGELKGVDLVERLEIDKVLAEQQLTAVLSADAAAGRSMLGKLLRADVLVILARERTKDGSVDPVSPVKLVICDTARGLRLVVEEFGRLEGDATIAAVVDLVRRAVERRAKPITEIVAVPPFVSNDLSTEFRSLQRPFAMVAEQTLLEQPGVLVVELAEARAIADEHVLAAGDDVARKLPLFLLGEFRHDAADASPDDEAAPLTLHLSIARGRQEIGRRELASVPRRDAAAAIRAAVAELFGKAKGKAVRAAKPEVDARQLADRAQRMFRLGNWLEALELAEASLLLRQDDLAMHLLAVQSLQNEHYGRKMRVDERVKAQLANLPEAIRERAYRRSAPAISAETARVSEEFAPILRRGRPHLEFVLRTKRLTTNDVGLANDHGMAGGLPALRDMYLRVLRHKYDKKVFDDSGNLAMQVRQASTDLDREEIRRWALKAVEFFPVPPDDKGQVLILGLIFTHDAFDQRDRAFAESCVPVLRGYDNPACKAAADALERRLKTNARSLLFDGGPAPAEAPQPAVAGRPAIRFERLSLDTVVAGWLPVGRDTDVLWNGSTLLVLRKEQGRRSLRPLAQIVGGDPSMFKETCVCFDGRHVWGWQNPGQIGLPTGLKRPVEGPRLVAIDLVANRAVSISTAEGLPALELSHVSIAAVAQGKVCVAGHIKDGGSTRVWLGMASLDQTGKKGSMKVFHEARDVLHGSGGRDIDRGYSHSGAYAIGGPVDGEAERVIVRLYETPSFDQVLAVDPKTLTTEKLGFSFRPMLNTGVAVEGRVMHWCWNKNSPTDYLFSMGGGDKQPRQSPFPVKVGDLARWNDRWVIADANAVFHETPRLDAPFKPLATAPLYPPTVRFSTQGLYLFPSSHYGLVMHDAVKQATFRVVDATQDPPTATFEPGQPIDPADDIVVVKERPSP